MLIKQTKLTDTKAEQLKGGAKRRFIAQTVVALRKGGQSLAARELGWNRVTIGKGIKELTKGFRGKKVKKVQGIDILPIKNLSLFRQSNYSKAASNSSS